MSQPSFNNWRAVAHTRYGTEHLLYVGGSGEQVKKNFPGAFYEILTPEEKESICRVTLERWFGAETSGNWQTKESLRVPRVHKSAV
jgi:hypothetical protein